MGQYVCRECGAAFESERRKQNGCCFDCSIQHVIDSADQLANKKGPYYDKWRENYERMRKAIKAARK